MLSGEDVRGYNTVVIMDHHVILLSLDPEGWRVLLETGGGVPPSCSKPDPVAISLTAKKTPCPNFEINTEFN